MTKASPITGDLLLRLTLGLKQWEHPLKGTLVEGLGDLIVFKRAGYTVHRDACGIYQVVRMRTLTWSAACSEEPIPRRAFADCQEHDLNPKLQTRKPPNT